MATCGTAEAAARTPLAFSEIPGWNEDALEEALGAYLRSCDAPNSAARPPNAVCAAARRLGPNADRAAARGFFENHFAPWRLVDGGKGDGLVTGYYEPELAASRDRRVGFEVPLLAAPAGLEAVPADAERGGLAPQLSHALRVGGALVALPTRAEIEAGRLAPAPPVIAWLASPIEAFFLHVQGSGRLLFADGATMSVTYAGKNGHAYTSVGRLLVERGEMLRDEVSMEAIKAWMAADPARARALMDENESYVFFREVTDAGPGPIGQQEVALTPGRSLAVDPAHHAPGTPVWLDTTVPDAKGEPVRFRHLMVAQDAGSAIRGAIRGDIFFGSGEAAGRRAGAMQAAGRMIVLLPHGEAP